jgi:hypothetical protein
MIQEGEGKVRFALGYPVVIDAGHDGHGILVISLEERSERVPTVAFLVVVPFPPHIHIIVTIVRSGWDRRTSTSNGMYGTEYAHDLEGIECIPVGIQCLLELDGEVKPTHVDFGK